MKSAYQKGVVHYHDRKPPTKLRHIAKPPGSHNLKSKSDFRGGQFKGGYYFKTDTAFVPTDQLDEYRVVFIYKVCLFCQLLRCTVFSCYYYYYYFFFLTFYKSRLCLEL